MTTEVRRLTPVQETLFLTLRGRARDARAPKPILRDITAAELVEALDDDPAGSNLPGSLVVQVALRAKMLDAAVRRFTVEHPDAVVVELGAGLDSRRIRVAPAPTVDWYDVDFPQVVALRERLLPLAALGHQVGRSLTDPGWTDTIPADRPTVLVADGLLAFLTEGQIVALLHHITDRFGHGELVFNDYGSWSSAPG